ncbi:MAG TPA: lytic transglycosylase domain-containing protein [Acidobacteriota bacterium]|jgi:soluble lytic murein transglycosylase-like protein
MDYLFSLVLSLCFAQGPLLHVAFAASGTTEEFAVEESTNANPNSPYDPFINKHCAEHGVDPDLVRAVMLTESTFRADAISHKGACGLMQLIPSTARRFGVENVMDPDQNIEGGVRYLRFLLDRFDNDLKLTLAAYNAGENAVKRAGGIPQYRETRNYVEKITARYGDTYRPVDASTPDPEVFSAD